MTKVARNPEGRVNPLDLEAYYALSKQIKELDDRKKILNKIIKTYFDNEPGVHIVGDYKVKLYHQDRSKMDQEKLVALLNRLDLTDCLKLIIVPDEQKVEEALYRGLIKPEDLETCIIPSKTLALLVTKE